MPYLCITCGLPCFSQPSCISIAGRVFLSLAKQQAGHVLYEMVAAISGLISLRVWLSKEPHRDRSSSKRRGLTEGRRSEMERAARGKGVDAFRSCTDWPKSLAKGDHLHGIWVALQVPVLDDARSTSAQRNGCKRSVRELMKLGVRSTLPETRRRVSTRCDWLDLMTEACTALGVTYRPDGNYLMVLRNKIL